MAIVNSSAEITSSFVDNYIEHLQELKKRIDTYCSEDENVGKLVELIYNVYNEGTFEWYMSKGLHIILSSDAIDEDRYLEEDDYSWRYNHYNVLENLIRVINRYLHTNDRNEESVAYGLNLKLVYDEEGKPVILVREEEFESECEMRKYYGYTNLPCDIISFLEKYATVRMNEKK